MTTSSIGATASIQPDTAQSQQTSSSGTNQVSATFNNFMTLLTTQLKNQDPLSPQDGAQFAAQLAQFSSLDQLVSINTRIGQLLDAHSSTKAASVLDTVTPSKGAVTPTAF
jgi:flagellar basal-body rod modification protein FlgD